MVNGTGIPEVDFDVGESYAGLLPITESANDPNKLFFWYFPSTNPSADKEILIWLTGGVSPPTFDPGTLSVANSRSRDVRLSAS